MRHNVAARPQSSHGATSARAPARNARAHHAGAQAPVHEPEAVPILQGMVIRSALRGASVTSEPFPRDGAPSDHASPTATQAGHTRPCGADEARAQAANRTIFGERRGKIVR